MVEVTEEQRTIEEVGALAEVTETQTIVAVVGMEVVITSIVEAQKKSSLVPQEALVE